MQVEMVTMVRGKAASLKNVLGKHGFQLSERGYWILSPALKTDDLGALENEIRRAGAGQEVEVRNIRKEWA